MNSLQAAKRWRASTCAARGGPSPAHYKLGELGHSLTRAARQTITRRGERVFERAFGRGRPADFAKHVDQGAQGDRHLPVARITEEQPIEFGRPVLQHPNQLPGPQKGIGPETAAVLWSEGLFRRFDNRRQVAAYAGLAPTPWQSGSIDHEQGVSKAGNPRLRTTMVELAWLRLQNQPASALSLWFHERVRRLGGRMRKTTIVALARKLLVALWRYTTAGVVIEGAVMKAAATRPISRT